MAWIDSSASAQLVVTDDVCGYQMLTREWWNVYKLRVRTITKEARALTKACAFSLASDVTHITQTGGTYFFERYTRHVERRRTNAADGWAVTVTEKWAALYRNGTRQCGAPASSFTEENPAALTSDELPE